MSCWLSPCWLSCCVGIIYRPAAAAATAAAGRSFAGRAGGQRRGRFSPAGARVRVLLQARERALQPDGRGLEPRRGGGVPEATGKGERANPTQPDRIKPGMDARVLTRFLVLGPPPPDSHMMPCRPGLVFVLVLAFFLLLLSECDVSCLLSCSSRRHGTILLCLRAVLTAGDSIMFSFRCQ